ncbi:MAG: class I SAM-dependent methyltransferase [Deltaproteobacteria bacterium]|nr:class I SAM-dependent methyltransferase [Deltaproteobacteria bacterium]
MLENFLAAQRVNAANALIPQQHRKGKILDVGCGTHPFFLLNTEFREKYGLDKVSRGKEPHHEIEIKGFDIERGAGIPFPDAFFDVVTMLAVIEHVEPEKCVDILKGIRRVLKPGGCCIITTPAFWTDGLLWFLSRIRLLSAEEIDEHKGSFSRQKLHALLQEAGYMAGDISSGYFEAFMNIWVRAKKE